MTRRDLVIKDLPSCFVLDKRIERFSGSIRNIFVRSDRWIRFIYRTWKIFKRETRVDQSCIRANFRNCVFIRSIFGYSTSRKNSSRVGQRGVPFAIFIIYSTGLKRLSRELKWSGGRGRTGHLIPPFRGWLERLKSKLQSFKYTDSQNGLFTFLANNRRI